MVFITENKQILLIWIFAGVLLIAVSITAVMGVPNFAPIEVTYATTTGSTGTTTSATTYSGTTKATEHPKSDVQGLINLNTATAEELMELDGVGEVIAQRILEYRETYGSFHSVDELLNVKGIGEKRLAAWRSQLTV